jgi:hypothetical protein
MGGERLLVIGDIRASRRMDAMRDQTILGLFHGAKLRESWLTMEEWEESPSQR